MPIGQRFLGSLRLWKFIRYKKCQFSPTSLRDVPGKKERTLEKSKGEEDGGFNI